MSSSSLIFGFSKNQKYDNFNVYVCNYLPIELLISFYTPPLRALSRASILLYRSVFSKLYDWSADGSESTLVTVASMLQTSGRRFCKKLNAEASEIKKLSSRSLASQNKIYWAKNKGAHHSITKEKHQVQCQFT